jgi:hypothetical protein
LASGTRRRGLGRAGHNTDPLPFRRAGRRERRRADDQSRRFAGEDTIAPDSTGILTSDFRSMLGFLGDLFAGWKRVPKHLDQQGNVTGWFRRSMGGYVILKELTSTAGVLRARPYFWQALLSVLVIVGTAYVALVGIGDISVPFEDNAATEAPEAP